MLMERAAALPPLYADQPGGQLQQQHTNAWQTLIQYETTKKTGTDNKSGLNISIWLADSPGIFKIVFS